MLFGEELEEALRHDGVAGGLADSDFLEREGEFLVDALEGEGGGVLGAEESREGAAAICFDDFHAIVAGDGGGGINDVLEEVVEVGALGAGKLGAEVATFAEELVAGGAGGLKENAAGACVGGLEVRGSELVAVLGDEFLLVIGGGADFVPQGGDAGREFFVTEGTQLADGEGGEVGAGDGVGFNSVEQRVGPGRTGGEGLDGVAAGCSFESGVAREDGGGGVWVVVLGEAAQGGARDGGVGG